MQQNNMYSSEYMEKNLAGITKPFRKGDQWYILYGNQRSELIEIAGELVQAPRQKSRNVLTFKLPYGNTKRYYLCEFCQGVQWIDYRNYSCQHIRRHHPEKCQICPVCQQLVLKSIFYSHNPYCSAKRRRNKRETLRRLTNDELLSGLFNRNNKKNIATINKSKNEGYLNDGDLQIIENNSIDSSYKLGQQYGESFNTVPAVDQTATKKLCTMSDLNDVQLLNSKINELVTDLFTNQSDYLSDTNKISVSVNETLTDENYGVDMIANEFNLLPSGLPSISTTYSDPVGNLMQPDLLESIMGPQSLKPSLGLTDTRYITTIDGYDENNNEFSDLLNVNLKRSYALDFNLYKNSVTNDDDSLATNDYSGLERKDFESNSLVSNPQNRSYMKYNNEVKSDDSTVKIQSADNKPFTVDDLSWNIKEKPSSNLCVDFSVNSNGKYKAFF